MKLYADSTREFIRATTQNRIVDTLKHAFEAHYRHAPAPSEINAWNNSLKAMALLIAAVWAVRASPVRPDTTKQNG